MFQKSKVGIFIGRFQPFHKNHEKILMDGLKSFDRVVVLVGSANRPITQKNPFTFDERFEMIHSVWKSNIGLSIKPINDYMYDEERWKKEAIEAAGIQSYEEGYLMGVHTDESSYYLNSFPMWKRHEAKIEFEDEFHSSDIRSIIYNNEIQQGEKQYHLKNMLSSSVFTIVNKIVREYSSQFLKLSDEYSAIEEERKSWENSPYPVQVVCSDALIMWRNKILLVIRNGRIGKGLYAFPGGHLEKNETLFECAVREANEETLIDKEKLKTRALDFAFTADSPYRSERSNRVISTLYIFDLSTFKECPPVKGSDDASRAIWVDIDDYLKDGSGLTFDDHYEIIKMLMKGLRNVR